MQMNELQAFIQKLKNNAGLKEALSFAPDAEAVAAIGRQVGLKVSAADMTHYPKRLDSLGADELELVAGGKHVVAADSNNLTIWSTFRCGCKPN